MNDQKIVFIHSLFRAGSTYFASQFDVTGDFCCFYEPLHEIAWFSRENPDALLQADNPDKRAQLRHPPSRQGYFQTLYDLWPQWTEHLTQTSIYSGYFNNDASNPLSGHPYWQSLVEHTPGNIVIQECRSSGRLPMLASAFPGTHIYLYRNPRDQWRSLQVSDYFDCRLQLIMRAENPPAIIEALNAHMGSSGEPLTTIETAIAYYADKPLTARDSYLCFYILWCLGFDTAMGSADVQVSIDLLSRDARYRTNLEKSLNARLGARLDFSTACSPTYELTVQDSVFFTSIEEDARQLLADSGWKKSRIDTVANAAMCFANNNPQHTRDSPPSNRSLATEVSLIDSRARVARNWDAEVCRIKRYQADLLDKLDQTTAALNSAKTELIGMQSQYNLLDTLYANSRLLVQATQSRCEVLKQENADLANAVISIQTSTSWRLTRPIRMVGTGCLTIRRWSQHFSKMHFDRRYLRSVLRWMYEAIKKTPAAPMILRTALARKIVHFVRSRYFKNIGEQPAETISMSDMTPRELAIFSELKQGIVSKIK